MKFNAAPSRTAGVVHPVLVPIILLLVVLARVPTLEAAEAGPGAKSVATTRTKTQAKTPAVRIVVLKGTYADQPSAPDADPMSLLLGGLEKPGSFFDLCEKLY